MQLNRIPYSLIPIRSSFIVLPIQSTGINPEFPPRERGMRKSWDEHMAPPLCRHMGLCPCTPYGQCSSSMTMTSLVKRHASLPLFPHWHPVNWSKSASQQSLPPHLPRHSGTEPFCSCCAEAQLPCLLCLIQSSPGICKRYWFQDPQRVLKSTDVLVAYIKWCSIGI